MPDDFPRESQFFMGDLEERWRERSSPGLSVSKHTAMSREGAVYEGLLGLELLG